MKANNLRLCLISLFILSVSISRVFAASYTVNKDNTCAAYPPYGDAKCSIQDTINAAADGDTIYIKAASQPANPTYEPITVTKKVKLIGLTSSSTQAWTAGTAGSASGAPIIAYQSPHDNLAKISHDNVEIMGLSFVGRQANAVTLTALGTQVTPTVNYVTLSYCTYTMGTSEVGAVDKGVAVDYGCTVNTAAISYCKFTGQTTNTSNWFYIGESGTGGSADGVKLTKNEIQNAMSIFELDRPIKNIEFLNNSFSNSWNVSDADSRVERPYGYVLIDEPTDDTNVINGITLTHNTFSNSTGTAPNEFAILVTDNVEEADAGGDWESNLALHFNNFLQGDAGSPYYPIVGFDYAVDPGFASSITATSNWWYSTSGPRSFDTASGSSTTADRSLYVSTSPWARAQVSGGAYAELSAVAAIQEITGTQMLNNNMYLKVRTTGGAATLAPTKYVSNPTGTSLSNGLAYFNLGIKSGADNIGAITATFYAPSGSTLASSPLYWHNGSSWTAVPSRQISTTSSNQTILSQSVSSTYITHSFGRAVTAFITQTASYVTPTINNITRTSISTLTQTFFALAGTTSSSSSSGSSTTTSASSSSSSSSGTTSSSSSSSSSTSSSSTTSSSLTSSTTSSLPSSSTTTKPFAPRLSLSPSELDFGDNTTAQVLTIANSGTGILTWNIYDNETEYNEGSGWIFSALPASGYITEIPQSVTVTVSRRNLDAGTYTASLPVTSNDENASVPISMEVAQREYPFLSLQPRLLLFLGATETAKSFSIANLLRNGALTWELGAPVYQKGKEQDWITTSPAGGYATTDTDSIQVTVSRDNLAPGLYSATIPVSTNAGSSTVTVIMLVQPGEGLSVSPSMLFFLGPSQTEQTFTITNTSSGSLAWEIGDPVYTGAEGWIASVSPASGSTSESADVTVSVSSEGLTFGLYSAEIPITSSGGGARVLVYLLAPLF